MQARNLRGGTRCFSPCNTKVPISQGNDARKAWGGNSSLSPCNPKSLTCQTVENRTKRSKTLAPTKVTKDCQGKTRSPFCCLTKECSQNAWGELQQKIPCSTKVTTCRTKEYGAVGSAAAGALPTVAILAAARAVQLAEMAAAALWPGRTCLSNGRNLCTQVGLPQDLHHPKRKQEAVLMAWFCFVCLKPLRSKKGHKKMPERKSKVKRCGPVWVL